MDENRTEKRENAPRIKWQTSFGTLLVKVVEGSDLFHPRTEKRRNLLRPREPDPDAVLLRVGIQNEDGVVLREYSCQMLYSGTQQTKGGLRINEEFCFEDVSSFFALRLSLYKFVEGEPASRVGSTSIPVSRLRENQTIEQYYSMQADDGTTLRSVVLLRLSFVLEGVKIAGAAEVSPRRQEISPKEAVIYEQTTAIPQTTYPLFPAAATTPTADASAEHRVLLPTGLIDYCLIAGPVITEVLATTPRSSSMAAVPGEEKQTIRPDDVVMDGITMALQRQLEPLPDVLRAGSADRGVQVTVWETFPVPTEDLPVPTKIEWFCFPNGARVIPSPTRPEPKMFTFIMVHGTNVTHGVCLHFFVQWPGEVEEGMLLSPVPTEEETLPMWVPCCVCFLTRDPFASQLMEVLKSCYRNCIEPRLDGYDKLLADPRKRRDSNWRNLLRPLEAFIVQLCLEAPLPFPGCFDVTAKLFDLQLTFAAPQMHALPHCCYSISEAARLLGPRTLLDLVCCALNEVKLLLYTKDIARLPVICEAVRTLLYPFQWEHVYVPVLPFLLLDLIQAPLPFILGIHVDCLPAIRPEVLRDVVMVNCDTGVIDASAVRIEPLPPMYDRWLLMATRALVYPELIGVELAADIAQAAPNPSKYMLVVEDDSLETSTQENKRDGDSGSGASIDQNQAIQLAFMDVMADMLQYLPHCLFFLHSTPIFNRSLFLNNFLDEGRRGFMMKVIDSQCFHRLIENIQDPFVSFFLRSIDRSESYSTSGQQPAEKKIPPSDAPLSEITTTEFERLSSLACFKDAVMHRLVRFAHTYGQPPLAALELDALFGEETLEQAEQPESTVSVAEQQQPDLPPASSLGARQQLRADSLGNLEDDHVPPPEAFKKVKSEMIGSSVSSHQAQRASKRASYSTLTAGSAPKETPAAIELQRAIQKVNEKQQTDSARTPSVASSRSRSPSFVGLQEHSELEIERSSGGRSLDDHSDAPVSFVDADMFEDYVAVGLVGFDWKLLNAHSGGVRVWTIEEISTLLQLDPAVVSEKVDVVGKPSAFQQLSAQFAQQPVESTAMSQVPTSDEQDEHRIQSCLATAFSATNLSEAAIHDLTAGCAPVLRHAHAREKLLSILRQPYRSNGSLGIYPLHSSAFEVLARLCFYMLQACAEDEDRLSAYQLLTLAGCYYQTARAGLPEENVEFLSTRICHHPFYQDPALWRDVLLSNLGQDPTAKNQQLSRTRAAQEVRSILYEMMNLGVNKHRATHFAQTVASEFRLTLDQFLALQRYITELWSQQPQTIAAGAGEEPLYDYARMQEMADGYGESRRIMGGVGGSVRQDEKEAEQYSGEDEKNTIPTTETSQGEQGVSPSFKLGRTEMLTFQPKLVENLEHEKAVTAIDMLGSWVVTGCTKGIVCVSDVVEGQCVMQLAAHTGQVTGILCTPAGIITTGHDCIVKLWRYPWLPDITAHRSAKCSWNVPVCFQELPDTDSVEAPSPRQPNLHHVNADLGLLAGREESRTLLTMSKTLSHFRMSFATISLHQHAITAVDFAMVPDGRLYLATADAGGVARVWSGTAGNNFECLLTGTLLAPITKILLVLPVASQRTTASARADEDNAASTSHLCVVGTLDGQLAVFDIITKKCTFSAAGHDGPIVQMQRTRPNEILTCAADRSVRLWDIRAETSDLSIYGHAGPVTCMTVGGWQDSVILTGSADGVIRIWDTRVDTAQPYAVLRGHTDRVTALWWDGSGMLLSAGYDGIVRQWDVFSGRCLLKLQGHSNAGITDFVCSRARPSGRDVSRIRSTDSLGSELVSEQSVMRLVTVAWDGTVRLWESTAPVPFRL